ILYGLHGERRIDERILPWLPGFANSPPVRTGNGAVGQRQLDVYGEVMDSLHLARRAGINSAAASWQMQCAMLDFLETVWREPDHGIWEVRGPTRQFIHSKVMAWVA